MAKIRPSGGYRELRSFQMATVIYDATYWFCERFLEPRGRMSDQMVQAARSGRRNIAEGSRASATSSQTELRLVNMARASLEELLLDYEDFLRHRRLRRWAMDDPEALAVRKIGQNPHPTDQSDRSDDHPSEDNPHYALYAKWLDHADPAVRANALLCLINQANYLLDKQIEALETAFVMEGGYSEQLAVARLAERNSKTTPQPTAINARKPAQPPQPPQSSQSSRLSPPPQPSRPAQSSKPLQSSRPPQPSKPLQSSRPPQSSRQADIPSCPKCGKAMSLRTAQKGRRAGKQFWGCTGYPDCKGVVDI